MADNSPYGSFRPMKPGDKGHWYKDQSPREYVSESKRWFINPRTGEIIPLRQYQNKQRGVTYTTYAKHREKRGVKKKQYKQRIDKGVKRKPILVASYQKPEPRIPLIERRRVKAIQSWNDASERADILKSAWARKRSEEYGMELSFRELPDVDKTAFWYYYHEIVDQGEPPSREAWDEEYNELFDMEFEDWFDIGYGETP